MNNLYSYIISKKAEGLKQLAVLIDPDKINHRLIELAEKNGVDHILIGGSIITENNLTTCIQEIKKRCSIPVTIFPGSYLQLSNEADALLLLSLISGRNPELLIGNHVMAAQSLRKSNVEIIPTGYILIDGGESTAVQYMSNTMPIPANKPEIAVATAIAGELLGLKLIYLEAGSGALQPVNERIIKSVRNAIDLPLIVGGGINNSTKVKTALSAGADMIVIGNALEQNENDIVEFAEIVHKMNQAQHIEK